MMTMEGYTKILNFTITRKGIFVLWCCQIGVIVKKLDLIKIFYTTPKQRADKVECDDLKTQRERRGLLMLRESSGIY